MAKKPLKGDGKTFEEKSIYEYSKMDVFNWCKENGHLSWLKEIKKMEEEVYVYPTEIRISPKDGKKHRFAVYERDGKPTAPTIKMAPIGFATIKRLWLEKFFPEKIPEAQPKEPTLDELLASEEALAAIAAEDAE